MATKTPAFFIKFNSGAGVSDVAWNSKQMGRPSDANLAKTVEVMSSAWGVNFTSARVIKTVSCGEVVATWAAGSK